MEKGRRETENKDMMYFHAKGILNLSDKKVQRHKERKEFLLRDR